MPAAIRLPSIGMSKGSGPRTAFRLRRARLGGGYEQVAADGVHNVQRRYRCVYRSILAADAESLKTFLEARGGHEPFLSPDPLPPGMPDAQWRCERFSGPSYVSATRRDMEVDLVEDFSP